jgi:ERCC4-type nuclease
MKVIIDERETSLYELCLNHENLNKETTILEKRVLQLGDILFTSDDETTTFLCIERKSLQDLLASIKDGRYSEQSYRLSNCFPNPHNVVYLLEGMLSTVKDKKLVISCIASLNYFKGFSVHRTVSLAETALYILCMADKMAREIKKGGRTYGSPIPPPLNTPGLNTPGLNTPGLNTPGLNTPGLNTPGLNTPGLNTPELNNTLMNPSVEKPLDSTDYCDVVKVSKKANITKENIGQLFLMQIPGISSAISIEIMKPFSSFLEFVDHIRSEPEYLSGIKVNGRKIGSNVIKGINEFILNK